MEVPSHCVINEALFLDRLISCVMSENSLLEPFPLHWVGASAASLSRLRSCVTELRIEQGVPMEHLFLLSALDLLHFGKLFQSLLFFAFFFKLFILSHELNRIIFLTWVVFISILRIVSTLLLLLHLRCIFLFCQNFLLFRFVPEISHLDELVIIAVLVSGEWVFYQG